MLWYFLGKHLCPKIDGQVLSTHICKRGCSRATMLSPSACLSNELGQAEYRMADKRSIVSCSLTQHIELKVSTMPTLRRFCIPPVPQTILSIRVWCIPRRGRYQTPLYAGRRYKKVRPRRFSCTCALRVCFASSIHTTLCR